MLARGAAAGLLPGIAAGRADEIINTLYQSRTVITGQDPERRGPGLIACFKLVLAKVSGDRRLLDDPAADLPPPPPPPRRRSNPAADRRPHIA